MRLQKTSSTSILNKIELFFNSPIFLNALSKKFDIALDDVTHDYGLQKYFDGYEISPHPDVRRKALTYMININPSPHSEELNYHTQYARFLPSKLYIQEYWKSNMHHDRSWMPWDWCETVKVQKKNNSMVIFKPSYNTLHAVRASYNHLVTQRTQLYGNLWYASQTEKLKAPNWRDFIIETTEQRRYNSLKTDEPII